MTIPPATAPRYRWDFELSSFCQCRFCENCGLGTESFNCDECMRETRGMDYCDSACWEYKLEWLDELVQEWSTNCGRNYMVVSGRAMGWQRTSGHTDAMPATGKELLKALTFSGGWTLNFRLDQDNLLTVRRWSHDEPTGASFIVSPAESDPEE